MKTLAYILTSAMLLCSPVLAKPGGDWSNVDPEIREWLKGLHRPDLWDGHTSSCCGEGDAYYADVGEVGADGEYYAIITDNRGNALTVGTKLKIRKESIQRTEGNPSGHVVIFASDSGYMFCFVPTGDG